MWTYVFAMLGGGGGARTPGGRDSRGGARQGWNDGGRGEVVVVGGVGAGGEFGDNWG